MPGDFAVADNAFCTPQVVCRRRNKSVCPWTCENITKKDMFVYLTVRGSSMLLHSLN